VEACVRFARSECCACTIARSHFFADKAAVAASASKEIALRIERREFQAALS
jgi:hypothetical protein